MLLTAKAYAEGARALQVFCTLLLDKAHSHPMKKVRADSDELVALLTPIVKAFVTDNGHVATNACMQVFGGHGFIKEWGMEQFVRDNRINMIYEGTNTIQSLDLLGRKVLGNQGATLKKLGKLIGALVQEEGVNEKMAGVHQPHRHPGRPDDQVHHRNRLQRHAKPRRSGRGRRRLPARGWPPGLGYLFAAWRKCRCVPLPTAAPTRSDTAKLQTARFYFAKLFPETVLSMRTARAGSKVLMDTDAALA